MTAREKDDYVKFAALGILVLQNTSLVLLMRHTLATRVPGQIKYVPSTAVFYMEVLKLATCMCVIAYQ